MDTYKETLKNTLSTRQVTRRLLDLCDRLDSESRKNAATSESARYEGSDLFLKTDHGNDDQAHRKILELYNKSVLYAPVDSDKLTLAYAHRSALLLHVRRYEDCLRDADRALRALIGNPNDALKVKLLCRKAKCLSALGSRVDSREIFEEAQQVLTDLQNDSGTIDEVLGKLLSSTKITLENDEEARTSASATSSTATTPEHAITSLDSLLIEESPEYGRHLRARRRLEAGEVLLVERMYALRVDQHHALTRCAHCLAVCWSAAACPDCTWALFCSEACRDEARRLHHDLECPVRPRLSCFDDELVEAFDLCLKLLCRGFNELGSLDRIKGELDVDQGEDIRYNGFVRNGKFENDTFRSILSLSDDLKDQTYKSDRFIKFVALIVICLAKYTKVLGDHYTWNGITDLANNEDAIFLGALIIKLYKISKINRQVILNSPRNCQTLSDSQNDPKKDGNVVALAVSPLSSLINHSCIPNAAHCCAKGRKLITYALKPIEKNTQIFISYTDDYRTIPLDARKHCLRFHNFTCSCTACVEKWSCDQDENNGQFNESKSSPEKLAENQKLRRKVADLKAEIANLSVRDQELLTRISSTIEESRALAEEPNFVVGSLNTDFKVVFERLNGIGRDDFYACDSSEASFK